MVPPSPPPAGPPAPHHAAAMAALSQLRCATDDADLVTAGRVDALHLDQGTARLSLHARPQEAAPMEAAAREARAALLALPGITAASVVLTAHRTDPPAPAARPHAAPSAATPAARPKLLADTRHIVAVASGKGGVGKSTTAVNLAIAFAQSGLRTGLLDADVYGPSLPTMLGQSTRPALRGDRIQPIEAWGMRCMSVGFMVDPDAAMIWRGPMVMGALEQMMGQVDWGPLDIMVIDLPPGTGDAQLTLSQRLNLTGAIIVSTPQDIALIDARRAVAMFRKVNVPVLGLIENMSWFGCPHCGTRSDIFGHGGAQAEAARLGIPVLGTIPLLMDVRRSADDGLPITATQPHSAAAQAYQGIAAAVRASLPA